MIARKSAKAKKTIKHRSRGFVVAIIATLMLLIGLPLIVNGLSRQTQLTTNAAGVLLDRSVFDRKDLIYGAEIGAWDMDGGTAVNNATARQNVIDAKIRIIRWGDWAKFDYMTQGGSTPKQTLAQFNNAVDGIRNLGAIPLIKLPPIWDKQCDGALDNWNLDWQKEIIKNAGNRVQLYEFANEPDNYCHWDAATYANNWKTTVPQLKKYARSLGFEIFVGGPAMANSYSGNLPYIQTLLTETAASYQQTGDRDYVPDFVSSHTYLTETENTSTAAMQSRIDSWGTFYDTVQSAINTAYSGINDPAGQPLAPQIKIADSEYNWTINNSNTLMNNQSYANYYMNAMFTMFRQHNIWFAPIFTIASHGGGALDLLNTDGTAKPLYNAYKAISTTDPLNNPLTPTPTSALPTPTNTPVPTSTPIPTPTTVPTATPAPKPAFSVYLDSLATGWTNKSWSATVNLKYTKQKYAGADSIQYIANAAWAGLALGTSNFSTTGYTYVQFAAKASTTGQQYAVFLSDPAGTQLSTPQPLANYGGDPVPTAWKVYKIPLANLNGANKTLGSVVIHEWKGMAQPAVYIDNMQFVN
jgi:hypothetical protein